MFIEFVDKKYNLHNKMNRFCTRALYQCDECKKQYVSVIYNRKQSIIKYKKDLCISCRQKVQYKLGIRNRQIEHCKILAKNQKGRTYEEMYGKKRANEMKEVLAEKFSGKNNPMYGKNYQACGLIKKAKLIKNKTYEEIYGIEKANQVKKLLSIRFSATKNPMYNKPSPQGSGNGWSGWYKGKYFRSLLELSYMIHLDNEGITWQSAESADFRIKYKNYKDEWCNYFPDFFLPETNEIIEIKPKKLVNSASNSLKFKYAKKQFNKFKVITEDDINKISLLELQVMVKNKTVKLIERYNNKLKEYIKNEKNK